MIKNINIGVCHRRAQEGSEPFFINWEDTKNRYMFSKLRSQVESMKDRLERYQKLFKGFEERIAYYEAELQKDPENLIYQLNLADWQQDLEQMRQNYLKQVDKY
jgi:hypothetical protein